MKSNLTSPTSRQTITARELSALAMKGDLTEIQKYDFSSTEINELVSYASIGSVQSFLGSYNALMLAAAYRHFHVVRYFIGEKNANCTIKGGRLRNFTAQDCAMQAWWFVKEPNKSMIQYFDNPSSADPRQTKQPLVLKSKKFLKREKPGVIEDLSKVAYTQQENEAYALGQAIMFLSDYKINTTTIMLRGSDPAQIIRLKATLLWFQHLSCHLHNNKIGQDILNAVLTPGVSLRYLTINSIVASPLEETWFRSKESQERVYITQWMPILYDNT